MKCLRPQSGDVGHLRDTELAEEEKSSGGEESERAVNINLQEMEQTIRAGALAQAPIAGGFLRLFTKIAAVHPTL